MQLSFRPQAVLFDLDGTLADTALGLHTATSAALKAIGVEPCTLEQTRTYLGNGPYMLLARAIARSQTPGSDILESDALKQASQVFNEVYGQEYCRGDKVFPGVKEVLQNLGAHGIKRAVVTNKPHQFVAPVLEKIGLLSLVDYYLGSGVIALKKPDPEPLLYVCRHFGVQANQAVMVGDSWNDIEAAKSAHMVAVGLTYGYNRGVDIRTSAPDYCFSEFKDVGQLILG